MEEYQPPFPDMSGFRRYQAIAGYLDATFTEALAVAILPRRPSHDDCEWDVTPPCPSKAVGWRYIRDEDLPAGGWWVRACAGCMMRRADYDLVPAPYARWYDAFGQFA